MAVGGLVTLESRFGPKETMDRLIAGVEAHGMAVVARFDHAKAAEGAGLELRPTEVVVFGNPRVGTALMRAVQTIGVDLPLKALVWEDAEGTTWLSYNEPHWLAVRHQAVEGQEAVLGAMATALAAVAAAATGGGKG